MDLTYEEIEEKYCPIVDWGIQEPFDLYIFEKFLPEFYTPSKKPWIMSIGTSSIKESLIMKKFHERIYDINPHSVKVTACNINPYSKDLSTFQDYDFKQFGHNEGDGTQDLTWVSPFLDNEDKRYQYDLTYIRNPDLIDLHLWHIIFEKAINYTKKDGAVVTLIRETDKQRYEDGLLDIIEKDFDIRPAFSEETKIEGYPYPNFHNTIGIFKPK